MFDGSMKQTKMTGLVSRRKALVLNGLIVSAYVAIAILADNPWVLFAGFLFLAIGIRCATMCWMVLWVSKESPGSAGSLLLVLFNLVAGLLLSVGVVYGLWWLGHFWLSGIKVIVSFIVVLVAYKSTFPVLPWRQQP
jgi:hypothetical protein